MTTLHDKIAHLRRARGLSQERLADLMGKSQGIVAKWETGRNRPTLKDVRNLAETLRVTIDDLLDDAAFDLEIIDENYLMRRIAADIRREHGPREVNRRLFVGLKLSGGDVAKSAAEVAAAIQARVIPPETGPRRRRPAR